MVTPNETIIMVDDILTRGATSDACRDILQQETGCKRVIGLFIRKDSVQLIKTDLWENAVYLYALSLLSGVGPQTLLRITRSYPSAEALTRASLEELHQSLDRKLDE